MNVLIGGRRSEKTTKILGLLKKTGGVLIVSSDIRKQTLLGTHHWLREWGNIKVVSWSENIPAEIRGFKPEVVYFDDVDDILKSVVGTKTIHAISLTADHVWIDFERKED